MKTPEISVIVPVYNAGKYIKPAVESILHQTYTNFELILIDDGSTDDSAQVIAQIKDPRIIYIKQQNAGMAAALNKGIALAKGNFIARQDADDISHKLRFEKQIDFFIKHPDTALVGTFAAIIDANGKPTGHFHKHETENNTLKAFLYFDNPFVHSSVMLRKNILEKTGAYDTTLHSLLQDFDLWFRISQVADVANIPEILQEYRQLDSGISKTSTNFSELVAGQSFLHLKKLTDDKSLREFTLFYHKCFQLSGNMNGKKATEVMHMTEANFLKKLPAKTTNTGDFFKPMYTHLKRVSLDFDVERNGSNPLMQFLFKLKRKIFYPYN